MHKKEHPCGRCYKTDVVNNITNILINEDDMTLIGILSEQDMRLDYFIPMIIKKTGKEMIL